MAAFGVAYAVTSPDIAAINARYAALSAKFDDMTPLMLQAGAIAAEATDRAFQTESTPAGALWPPLAKKTQDAFVAKGVRRGAHPILQVTGQLAASPAPQVFPLAMIFGTNLVQSARQQFGGGGIPSREYIGLGPQDLSAIEKAAVAFFGV